MFQRKTVDPVGLDSVLLHFFRSGDGKIQNLSLLLRCDVIEQIMQAVDPDSPILHGRTHSLSGYVSESGRPGR